MHKRPTLADFRKKAMQNEEFRKEYERLAPGYERISGQIKQRILKRRKKRLSELLHGAK